MAKKYWDLKDRIVSKAAITPHDTNLNEFDAIFVGTGGDIATVSVKDSAAVTLKNYGDGEWLPEAVTKVMSTGTTASDIVGVHLSKNPT